MKNSAKQTAFVGCKAACGVRWVAHAFEAGIGSAHDWLPIGPSDLNDRNTQFDTWKDSDRDLLITHATSSIVAYG